MKIKRVLSCLLSAMTALTVCSALGGCYHIAFREEIQQYDKVAYIDDNHKKISFRGKIYREVDLNESYRKGFTGNYYRFLNYDRKIVGIDKNIGWLYTGCTPLWGTYEGDEEVIWLARDAHLGNIWNFLREDIELPTLETCVLEMGRVERYDWEEGDPQIILPENTCLWDIIDKDFTVDYFEMESFVGELTFKVRDFTYLWTREFYVYERRGELYFTEYQNYYYEGLRAAYRVKDEYQYPFKALFKKDAQGGKQ